MHTIRDTPPNRDGICALSINNDNSFLAYPGSSLVGEVQIFDITNLKVCFCDLSRDRHFVSCIILTTIIFVTQAVMTVAAHDSPIAALAFNSTATKLATASEKGTVLRVFSIPERERVFEFRRGMKRCVKISSLAFSNDSMFLCASSNTETVHVFKLETPGQEKSQVVTDESGTWMGYLNKVLSSSANYLPSQVSNVLSQGRDFATVKLPVSGPKNVCAITTIQKLLRVVVAAYDGYLYVYNLDPQNGGECDLIRQHRLFELSSSVSGSATAAPHGGDQGSPSAGPESPKYNNLAQGKNVHDNEDDDVEGNKQD